MSEKECPIQEETIESAGEDACLQDFDVTTTERHDVAIIDIPAQQNDISQQGVVLNADGDEIDIFVGQDIGPEASLVSEAISEESGIALPEIEDVDEKLSEGEVSPPSEDSLGRRKRKPSRYHDSMFDIPTNLLNINRTINPEEFRAFHSKGQKQKEKGKKPVTVPAFIKASKAPKLETVSDGKVSPYGSPAESPTTYSDFDDDTLDPSNKFKFKMRKDHIIQNVCGGPTAYKCDICLMTFPRSFSLRRHYTRRHINPKYVPPRTESATGNAETSTEAGESQEPADIYGDDQDKHLYACKMCSRSLIYFKHKNELHVHCLENHTTEPRRPVSLFKCDICRRPYSTKHELERHKRTHSGERPYQCGYCNKTFPTSTNARRHERTHTGDRPHTCKICNKGFIQRTDMVKHLRSMHKMKVTKTKAQKSGFTNEGKHTKNGGADGSGKVFETDKSNEFQENIDFAAYLKLDQHISGTLMGEGVSASNYSGKDTASNGNKNGNSPAKNTNLRDLPPSQIMGEDGKMEKMHRCPECSKMFTSNINLRRHYKLKHERNQIYQSAEPVSMVVEKYKMMDDGASNVNKEDKSNGEKGNVPTLLAGNDNSDNKDADGPLKANDSTEGQESVKDEICSTSTATPVKKEIKPGKHSKLSSIVQRLASKINAEKSVSPENMDSPLLVTPEKEPISQLEEFGNQIFADTTSPNDSTSPKRNKRKPSSVQHVPVKEDDTPREIPKHKSMIPDNYKQHIRKVGSRPEKEPGTVGGIYRKVLATGTRPRSNVEQRKTEYGVFANRERYGRLSSSCRTEDNMRETSVKMNQFADLSQRSAPYHARPGSGDRRQSGAPEKRQDTSRIETFLSQCYSSRRCDVPQNAILDRTVPVRDSNSANRKLKYNMKHFTIERSNEHLPAAAYFSRRDPGFSPEPKNENATDVPSDKNWGENDAPLDLRVQCKRDAPGYVVRDDGVLDFSQKTRDSVTKSKPHVDNQGPRPPVQNPPRVKVEPRKNAAVFSDRRYPEPYSRPFPEEIPPWAGRQKYIDRDACQPSHAAIDHRRDIIHGRPTSSKPGKPYKFHCVDFKPPVPRGPVVIDSKGRMQQSFRSYRDHPYPMPRGGPLMGRRGYTPTNAYLPPPTQDDPRPYMTDRIMPGQMQHKHFSHGSRYSQHAMATPRYTHARDSLPSYPARRPNHNWHPDQRRDPRFAHFDQSSPSSGNLRPILPKADWSADMIQKSTWKDDPRPIPSSIQRLAMKKSQGPSPFDRWDIFDDRDMMNRCIKKAQQSLHNEPANDSVKRAKSEAFDRNSAAYKTSQSISSYIKKISSDRSRGRDKHFAMAPGSIKPRVPRFIPGTADVGVRNQAMTQKVDAGSGMFEMLNLTSSMRSSYPKRGDLEHSEHPKETVKREPEPSHEEISDREKLTMTPGLESNHDVSESNLTKVQDGDTSVESHVAENLRKTSADDQKPEIAPESIPMDLVKCNPTSSGTNENLTPKSEIFEGYQFSGKLVNRRHTQAHPGEENVSSNDEDASANLKRGLKRTCSNDSNPGDSLSDEGDASSRKLIKKLKLRVIKSSGSERKKYWTLVEQDGPMRLTTTNSPEPETLADGADKTDVEVTEPSEPRDCAVVSDKLSACDEKVEELVDDQNSVEPASQDEEMVEAPIRDDAEKEFEVESVTEAKQDFTKEKEAEKDFFRDGENDFTKESENDFVREVENDLQQEAGENFIKESENDLVKEDEKDFEQEADNKLIKETENDFVQEAEKDFEQEAEKEQEIAVQDSPQTAVPETNIERQSPEIELPCEPEVENKSTLNIIMTGNQVETALTAIKTDIADDVESSEESEPDSAENAILSDPGDGDDVTEHIGKSDTSFSTSDPIEMLPEELFYSTTTEENDHVNMESQDEQTPPVPKTEVSPVQGVFPAMITTTVEKSDETQNSESTGPVLPRKTRSGGVPKAGKSVESAVKNTENAPAAKVVSVAELAANRLRRSVRIRKTSSDKDAAAKKKK